MEEGEWDVQGDGIATPNRAISMELIAWWNAFSEYKMYICIISRQRHAVPQEDKDMFNYIVNTVAAYDFTISQLGKWEDKLSSPDHPK